MPYIKPSDVRSPKTKWYLFEVILDRGPLNCAYALGEWEGERRIGFRWNGDDDNPIGNPQSRGLPTWTMLDTALHEGVVDLLPTQKREATLTFLGAKGR